MTNLITEARELCAAATPGPWWYNDEDSWLGHGERTKFNGGILASAEYDWEENESKIEIRSTDAAFITRSRTLIPELCDALEKYRWIPVTERLPTGCGYYLSVVERIAPDELGGNNTRVKIMRWLGADWRYPTHIPKWINEAITETVTHWMPLPAAAGARMDGTTP